MSTPGCQVTDGGAITAMDGDHSDFGGNAAVAGNGVVSGQQDYTDHTAGGVRIVLHSTQLLALTCDAARTAGTIYGQADINGAPGHAFIVDVTDPDVGSAPDTYRVRTDTGYDSGPQPTLASDAIEFNSPGNAS